MQLKTSFGSLKCKMYFMKKLKLLLNVVFHKRHKVMFCKFSSRNIFNVSTNH